MKEKKTNDDDGDDILCLCGILSFLSVSEHWIIRSYRPREPHNSQDVCRDYLIDNKKAHCWQIDNT